MPRPAENQGIEYWIRNQVGLFVNAFFVLLRLQRLRDRWLAHQRLQLSWLYYFSILLLSLIESVFLLWFWMLWLLIIKWMSSRSVWLHYQDQERCKRTFLGVSFKYRFWKEKDPMEHFVTIIFIMDLICILNNTKNLSLHFT